MDIISKIRKLQWERDWSDYDLAKRAEISNATLSSVYRRGNAPKIDTLHCICNAFGITLAQFFLEDEGIEILSEQEKQMLAAFRRLSPARQKALIALFTEQ